MENPKKSFINKPWTLTQVTSIFSSQLNFNQYKPYLDLVSFSIKINRPHILFFHVISASYPLKTFFKI